MVSGDKFFVYGGGRWREVDAATGRIDGWGSARFVVARGGRLEAARTTGVLASLRALTAGQPSATRAGPQLSYKYPRPKGYTSRDGNQAGCQRAHCQCCHHNNNGNNCTSKTTCIKASIAIQCDEVENIATKRKPAGQQGYTPRATSRTKRNRDSTSSEEPTHKVTTVATVHSPEIPEPKRHQNSTNTIKSDKDVPALATFKRSSKKSLTLRKVGFKRKRSSSSNEDMIKIESRKISDDKISKYLQPKSKKPKETNETTSDGSLPKRRTRQNISLVISSDSSDFEPTKRSKNPKPSKRQKSSSIDIPIKNKPGTKKATEESSSTDKADPKRAGEGTETGFHFGSSQQDTCKELVIDERDVEILRLFLQKHYPDEELLRFDTDNEYKKMHFYQINPLVNIERCPQIERMIRSESQLSLVDFASKLGLQSISEASSNKSKMNRIRRRKQNCYVVSDSDSTTDDKENINKPVRRSKRIGSDKVLKESLNKGRDKTRNDRERRVESKTREGSDEREVIQTKDYKERTVASKTRNDKERRVERKMRDDTERKKASIRKDDKERTVARKTRDTNERRVERQARESSEEREAIKTKYSKERQIETRVTRKDTDRRETSKTRDDKEKREVNKTMEINKKRETDKTMDTEELSSDNDDRVFKSKKANVKMVYLKPKAVISTKRPALREYTNLEDHAIISWVSSADRAYCVNGNRLWRRLEEQYQRITGQGRTWHSLRNRYLRYILPQLGSLALPQSQQARLRAAAATGELKARKGEPRRNSIFTQAPRGAFSRRPAQRLISGGSEAEGSPIREVAPAKEPAKFSGPSNRASRTPRAPSPRAPSSRSSDRSRQFNRRQQAKQHNSDRSSNASKDHSWRGSVERPAANMSTSNESTSGESHRDNSLTDSIVASRRKSNRLNTTNQSLTNRRNSPESNRRRSSRKPMISSRRTLIESTKHKSTSNESSSGESHRDNSPTDSIVMSRRKSNRLNTPNDQSLSNRRNSPESNRRRSPRKSMMSPRRTLIESTKHKSDELVKPEDVPESRLLRSDHLVKLPRLRKLFNPKAVL